MLRITPWFPSGRWCNFFVMLRISLAIVLGFTLHNDCSLVIGLNTTGIPAGRSFLYDTRVNGVLSSSTSMASSTE
uniref:Putative secreted protein n=1 Tax=Ixodes ricinus TaxID=34613 RepID=A0A147BV64_IXORI